VQILVALSLILDGMDTLHLCCSLIGLLYDLVLDLVKLVQSVLLHYLELHQSVLLLLVNSLILSVLNSICHFSFMPWVLQAVLVL
jgi:hypothetical protein